MLVPHNVVAADVLAEQQDTILCTYSSLLKVSSGAWWGRL